MNTLDLTYCLFYKIWENKEFKNVENFQNVQNMQNAHNSQLSVSQSVIVKVAQNEEEDSVKEIIVSWANRDEHLGSHLLSVLQNMGK